MTETWPKPETANSYLERLSIHRYDRIWRKGGRTLLTVRNTIPKQLESNEEMLMWEIHPQNKKKSLLPSWG